MRRRLEREGHLRTREKKKCHGGCLLGRASCDGNLACLASADYQEGAWSCNASADRLAARKTAPWQATATLESCYCSTKKPRAACSAVTHAQDPHKPMKCVGGIATGSSDLYVEAISAPCTIASSKHQHLSLHRVTRNQPRARM